MNIYSFILFLFENGERKRKLQNIHHKTLHEADLSYEVVMVGPLCRTSSQRHSLNSMCFVTFFCLLPAVNHVDVTSGAFGGYFLLLKKIVNYYVSYVKL
jgi:hypothetical protein